MSSSLPSERRLRHHLKSFSSVELSVQHELRWDCISNWVRRSHCQHPQNLEQWLLAHKLNCLACFGDWECVFCREGLGLSENCLVQLSGMKLCRKRSCWCMFPLCIVPGPYTRFLLLQSLFPSDILALIALTFLRCDFAKVSPLMMWRKNLGTVTTLPNYFPSGERW